MLLASLFTSCGLLDMEFDENVQMAYDMQLDHDTVYVAVGDSIVLQPVFTPDSVINREVFFSSAHEEIAYIHNDTIIAVSEGETVISAISVMNEKMAFCQVFVLPPWEVNIYNYSDDMVAYLCNFVKTGDPNDGKLPLWNKCKKDKDVMSFGNDISVKGKMKMLIYNTLTNKPVGE